MTSTLGLYTYQFVAIDVHDGDTIKVDVDAGFHMHYHTRFRLSGLNCPELATPAGPPARDFTAAWLKAAKKLTAHIVGPDKYGDRWNAVVYRDSDSVTLNAALLAAGHAVVMK